MFQKGHFEVHAVGNQQNLESAKKNTIKSNQLRLYEYDFNVNSKNKRINLKMRKGSNRWTAAFKPPRKYAHHWGSSRLFQSDKRTHI